MSVNNQNSDILNKVLNLVSRQFDLDNKSIDVEKSLEEFNADYLDKIEIVMRLEDEFGIQISDDEVDQIVYIKDLVSIISSKK